MSRTSERYLDDFRIHLTTFMAAVLILISTFVFYDGVVLRWVFAFLVVMEAIESGYAWIMFKRTDKEL